MPTEIEATCGEASEPFWVRFAVGVSQLESIQQPSLELGLERFLSHRTCASVPTAGRSESASRRIDTSEIAGHCHCVGGLADLSTLYDELSGPTRPLFAPDGTSRKRRYDDPSV